MTSLWKHPCNQLPLHLPSHWKERKDNQITMIPENHNSDTTDSDEEEDTFHYWLRRPIGRQQKPETYPPHQIPACALQHSPVLPNETLTCMPQGHPVQRDTYQRVTPTCEPVPVGQRETREERPYIHDYPADVAQPDVGDDQDGNPVHEERPQTPSSESHTTLRRCTRERRPGRVLTYPSLGHPTYQPCPTVNTIGTHIIPHSPIYPPPHYILPFQATPVAPYPHLPFTYPIYAY